MELEGVTEVQPADDDFQHYFTVSRIMQLQCETKRGTDFQVICTSCREEHPKIVSFNQKVSHPAAYYQ
jgi:hypothetical protein